MSLCALLHNTISCLENYHLTLLNFLQESREAGRPFGTIEDDIVALINSCQLSDYRYRCEVWCLVPEFLFTNTSPALLLVASPQTYKPLYSLSRRNTASPNCIYLITHLKSCSNLAILDLDMKSKRSREVENDSPNARIPFSSGQTKASANFVHLEGSCQEMPQYLIDDIKLHIASGGNEDFARSLWPQSKSLAQPKLGTQTRFELFHSPNVILPAGRFLYKRGLQVVVVGLPGLGPKAFRFVIATHRKEIIFDPNGRRGCFGYNWDIWMPQRFRDPQYNKQTPRILRVYRQIPKLIESGIEERAVDEQDTPPTKKCKIALKISSKKLASFPSGSATVSTHESLRRKFVPDLDQARRTDSSTSTAKPQDVSMLRADVLAATVLPSQMALAPSTSLEVAATSQYQGSVVEDAETITVVRPSSISTGNINLSYSGVGIGGPAAKDDLHTPENILTTPRNAINPNSPDKSPTINQASVAAQTHGENLTRMINGNKNSQLAAYPGPSPKLPKTIPQAKHDNIIVIEDDDDEPRTKKEVANTDYTYDPWAITVPPPSYYTGIAHLPAMNAFNAFQAPHSVPVPPQHYFSHATNPQDPYQNVEVEFRDNNDAVRGQEPFRRCASTRNFLEAALEADIIETNTRMFIVQIGARRPTKMRLDDDESFTEKLLQPLSELLNHSRGAMITIRVHGFVSVRA